MAVTGVKHSELSTYNSGLLDGSEVIGVFEDGVPETQGISTAQLFINAPYPSLTSYAGGQLAGDEIIGAYVTAAGEVQGITTQEIIDNLPSDGILLTEVDELPSHDGSVLDGSEIVAVYEDDESTVKGVTIDQLSNNRKIGFEEFGSLSGDDAGSGVYMGGFRSYIGLIPLVNANDKEFVLGRISGARNSFSNGGELRIYAENYPHSGNGLAVNSTSATVRSIEGGGEGRLVYFDHDGYTWVGVEYKGGGSGINQDVRFEGRTISESGNEDLYPKVVDFANLSNLNAYAGDKADHTEELGTKKIYGKLEHENEYGRIFLADARSGSPDPAIHLRRHNYETEDVFQIRTLGSLSNEKLAIDWWDGSSSTITNITKFDKNGDVEVFGTFTANNKNFKIDHPSKDNKILRHGSLEGPESGVYQRGTIDSETTIELPDYWPDLVREDSVTVNLTPVAGFQKLYVKSKAADQIEVGIGNGAVEDIHCDYTVYAERKDIPSLVVEEEKEAQMPA